VRVGTVHPSVGINCGRVGIARGDRAGVVRGLKWYQPCSPVDTAHTMTGAVSTDRGIARYWCTWPVAMCHTDWTMIFSLNLKLVA
jgi:hypothetical protein